MKNHAPQSHSKTIHQSYLLKVSTVLIATGLLSGCLNGTEESISPDRETQVTDSVIDEHLYHRNAKAMLMDPWGDLVVIAEHAPIYWADSERKSDIYF